MSVVPNSLIRMVRGDDGGADAAGQGPGHVVFAALDLVREGLARLDGAAAWSLSDGQVRDAVAEWAQVLSGVEAVWLGLVRDLDARPDAVPGARAGAVARTFLVHRVRLDARQAAKDVAAAKAAALDAGLLPGLGAALARGEVTRGHVDAAVSVVARIPARKLVEVDAEGLSGAQRMDAFLTEQARVFPPKTVEGLAREVLHRLDPSGGDRYDPDTFTRRGVTCGQDSTRTVFGRFQFDPANGAVFKAGDAHAKPTPQATATATAPDGQQVLLRDGRTLQQRRADALMANVRKAITTDTATGPGGNRQTPAPGPGPAATQVLVIATPEQVAAARRAIPTPTDEPGHRTAEGTQSPAGEGTRSQVAEQVSVQDRGRAGCSAAGLADCLQTGPLDTATLGLLTCDAILQAVLTAPSGAVLNLGRAIRTASPAQKKALTVRDHGCVIPGCTAPLAACDAHHLRRWQHTGRTDITNLASSAGPTTPPSTPESGP
jgi:hypothetical protein